jgi:hypothetical protein
MGPRRMHEGLITGEPGIFWLKEAASKDPTSYLSLRSGPPVIDGFEAVLLICKGISDKILNACVDFLKRFGMGGQLSHRSE